MRKRERERVLQVLRIHAFVCMHLGNVQTLRRRPEHIKISHFEITRDIFSQYDLLLRFLQTCNHVLQQVQLSSSNNNYSTATAATTTTATIKCCCHLQNATRQTPSQKRVEEIIIVSSVVIVVVTKPCSVLFLYPLPIGQEGIKVLLNAQGNVLECISRIQYMLNILHPIVHLTVLPQIHI